MKGRNIPFFRIILLIAILGGAFFLYKTIEFEQIDHDVDASDEARLNPFLAAGRLLETDGFSYSVASDRRVFSDLGEEPIGVLWISDIGIIETEIEAQQILDWIATGGHLLISSRNEAPFDESKASHWLMEQFGIVPLDSDRAEDAKLTENWEEDFYFLELPFAPAGTPPVEIFNQTWPYFKSATTLPDNSHDIINSTYLIHRALGEGYLTYYADSQLFDNEFIDQDDEAYLLLWLVQPAKPKLVTMVLRLAEAPKLFKVLWSKFSLAICLSTLVLAGFLRWAASRLGPVELELPPIKNNIIAHLEARGNFWHQHNYTPKVLDNIQQATLDSLNQQDGQSRMLLEHDVNNVDANKAAAIKQACDILDCTPAQAESTLFSRTVKNATLVQTVRALQRLNHRKIFKSE